MSRRYLVYHAAELYARERYPGVQVAYSSKPFTPEGDVCRTHLLLRFPGGWRSRIFTTRESTKRRVPGVRIRLWSEDWAPSVLWATRAELCWYAGWAVERSRVEIPFDLICSHKALQWFYTPAALADYREAMRIHD